MRVEGIGIVVVVFGCLGLLMPPAFLIYVFLAAGLLGSAAAIVLTSLGSAPILPAHLLLGFIAVALLRRRNDRDTVLRSLMFPHDGFWLLLTAIYAAVSAIFMPRIFAGSTYVYAIARSVHDSAIVLTPLAPTSGNITQTIYFISDLVCFLVFYSQACRPSQFRTIVYAVLVAAAGNLVFATLDFVTYRTHTTELLSYIRNAHYSMLDGATVDGFKRVVGSFPEASTFAYITVGLFAFCLRLRLAGIRPWLTGALAAGSFWALLASTSSSGYGAGSVFLLALYGFSLWQFLIRGGPNPTAVFLAVAPVAAAVVIIALRLDEPLWRVVSNVASSTVTHKLSSSSAIERAAWTERAFAVFTSTYGLGGGTGTVRASSFPVAVLANIGIPGALFYASLLVRILGWRKDRWTAPFPAACQSAARWGCFAELIASSVAGGSLDLGLLFFIFAGLAAGGPAASTAAARPPVGQLSSAPAIIPLGQPGLGPVRS